MKNKKNKILLYVSCIIGQVFAWLICLKANATHHDMITITITVIYTSNRAVTYTRPNLSHIPLNIEEVRKLAFDV